MPANTVKTEAPAASQLTLLFPSSHQEKLDNISKKDLYVLENLPQLMMQFWLGPREALQNENLQNPEIPSFIISEIREALEEHEKHGFENFSSEELMKEIFDVFVLFVTEIIKQQRQYLFADATGILATLHINDLADSPIYDRLAEITGNLAATDADKLYQELFALLLTLTINTPCDFAFSQALIEVLKKNWRNYPREYFQVYDPILKRDLTVEEQIAKVEHVRKCLRFLRNHPAGDLVDEHHQFTYMIHDFTHSELAFDNLTKTVETTLLKDEKGNYLPIERNTLTPGVDHPVKKMASGVLVYTSYPK